MRPNRATVMGLALARLLDAGVVDAWPVRLQDERWTVVNRQDYGVRVTVWLRSGSVTRGPQSLGCGVLVMLEALNLP